MKQSPSTPVRLLLYEDSEADALLLLQALKQESFAVSSHRVEKLEDFKAALKAGLWDIVVADYTIPGSSGLEGLQVVRSQDLDLPVIIVSGLAGEELAVESMRAGAQDYVTKSNLRRLGLAIKREVQEARRRHEWKQGKAVLRQSETRFQTLARITPAGICRTDERGNCVYINEQWSVITGLGSEQALGRPWTEPIGNHDVNHIRRKWQEALAQQRPFRAEISFAHPDHNTRWAIAQVVPEHDTEGKVVGFVGTITDITDRKLAEEALRKRETQLAEAQAMAQCGSWDWDLQTNTITWSDELFRIFGMAPQAAPLLYEEFLKLVHPEDLERKEAQIGVALRELRPFEHEYRIVRPDGAGRVIRSQGQIERDETGLAVRMHGTAQDLTERKELESALETSERKYRHLVETSHDLIWSMDAEGRITFVNQAAKQFYGRDPQAVLGHVFLEYVHPEDAPAAEAVFRDAMSSGQTRANFECRVIRENGSVVTISTRSEILRDAQGMIIGASGTSTDISALKATKEALVGSERRLHALSRRLLDLQETERRHLARELHDEVGQSLSAAKVSLDTILRYPDPQGVEKQIKASVAILDNLLQQVRALSLKLRPPMLDDFGLTSSLRWLLGQHSERADFCVHFQADSLRKRFDPLVENVCFRVCQEALTNVVRHARAQNVTVKLQCQNQTLHLIIQDDGVGFDPEIVQRQAERGSSLGLLGMEERVSMGGGRFELKSAPGRGTQVHAQFPLKEPEPG